MFMLPSLYPSFQKFSYYFGHPVSTVFSFSQHLWSYRVCRGLGSYQDLTLSRKEGRFKEDRYMQKVCTVPAVSSLTV